MAKPTQPSLSCVLNAVLAEEEAFATPILTNVVSFENKLLIKIEDIRLLTAFAEHAANKNLQILSTRPTKLWLKDAKTQILLDEQVECVLKFFMDGVNGDESKGKYVSVSASIQRTSKSKHDPGRPVFVLVFVKGTKGEIEMKSFTTKIDGKDRGIKKFLEKTKVCNHIADDGSVTFAISVML